MAAKRKLSQCLDDLRSHLECPICMDGPILPPIHQCPKGHVLCQPCSVKVTRCPSCKSTPVNIRNLALESVFGEIEVSCPNAPQCDVTRKYSDIMDHAKSCDFRPVKCPWCYEMLLMKPADIFQHMQEQHHAKQVFSKCEGDNSAVAQWCVTNADGATHEVWETGNALIEAFGCYFLAHFEAVNPRKIGADDESDSDDDPDTSCETNWLHYSAYLRFLGPDSQAKQFIYEVSAKQSDPYRVFSFSSVPVCIRSDDVKYEDCLTLKRSVAHALSGKEYDDECGLKLDLTFIVRNRARSM